MIQSELLLNLKFTRHFFFGPESSLAFGTWPESCRDTLITDSTKSYKRHSRYLSDSQQTEKWQWLVLLGPAKRYHPGKQDQGLIASLIWWDSKPYSPQECCNHQATKYYQVDGSIQWAHPVPAFAKEKQEFRYCLCSFLCWLAPSSSLAKGIFCRPF